MCGFKRDGKLKALSLCDVGEYNYEGVGIAFDAGKDTADDTYIPTLEDILDDASY